MKRLKALSRNYYIVLTAIFFFWMIFFDSNSLIGVYNVKSKIADLEDQKAYYEEKIVEVRETRDELLTDSEKLEKFAREKYLMKREKEDLYVIQTEE